MLKKEAKVKDRFKRTSRNTVSKDCFYAKCKCCKEKREEKQYIVTQ